MKRSELKQMIKEEILKEASKFKGSKHWSKQSDDARWFFQDVLENSLSPEAKKIAKQGMAIIKKLWPLLPRG